jgi:hypothetical protein
MPAPSAVLHAIVPAVRVIVMWEPIASVIKPVAADDAK